MRRLVRIALFLLFCVSSARSMDIFGDFSLVTRFGLSDGDFLFNYEAVDLKFKHEVSSQLSGFIDLRLGYLTHPADSSSYDNLLQPGGLSALTSLYPFEISLREAFFTYTDLFVKKLDFTAGIQRINWGTADMFNPTDILNPIDYSDPFDFGRKIPSLAFKFQYYFNWQDSSLQLVLEPYSQLARLTPIFFETLEDKLFEEITNQMAGMSEFVDLSGGWSGQEIVAPPANITNGLAAIKYSLNVAGFDLSLNLATRLNDFPTLISMSGVIDADVPVDITADVTGVYYVSTGETNVITNSIITNMGSTNITLRERSYQLGYGREYEIGLDFARDFGSFLLWGEMGVFFPREIVSPAVIDTYAYAHGPVHVDITEVVVTVILTFTNYTTNTSESNFTISTNVYEKVTEQAVSVSNRPYVKYTIGMDKNFDGGWYMNLQFCHGLFNERGTWGPNRVQDYFVGVLQKSLLRDKLILQFAGMLNINNLYSALTSGDLLQYTADHYGVSAQFSAEYSPIMDIKMEAGFMLLHGTEASLGYMKDMDTVYFKFSYQF